MSDTQNPQQQKVNLVDSPEYRDLYANSVQVRMSVWDFMLVFGTIQGQSPNEVAIKNLAGIYLSPQQAKALFGVLGQNLQQYEQAFGEIQLEPLQAGQPGRGPIN